MLFLRRPPHGEVEILSQILSICSLYKSEFTQSSVWTGKHAEEVVVA